VLHRFDAPIAREGVPSEIVCSSTGGSVTNRSPLPRRGRSRAGPHDQARAAASCAGWKSLGPLSATHARGCHRHCLSRHRSTAARWTASASGCDGCPQGCSAHPPSRPHLGCPSRGCPVATRGCWSNRGRCRPQRASSDALRPGCCCHDRRRDIHRSVPLRSSAPHKRLWLGGASARPRLPLRGFRRGWAHWPTSGAAATDDAGPPPRSVGRAGRPAATTR